MEPADHPSELLRKIGREMERQTRLLTTIANCAVFMVVVTVIGLALGVAVAAGALST